MDLEMKEQLIWDEYGRPEGIVLVNKPTGITSHDVVYQLRKKYGIKKIGHAGALDPFAEGLLICLIGKATKLSDSFLELDKSYEAEVLLGIATDSGDTEGKVEKIKEERSKIKDLEIQKVLQSFTPAYDQFVPVFSSVKVDGEKLRKLARRYEKFEIVDSKSEISRSVDSKSVGQNQDDRRLAMDDNNQLTVSKKVLFYVGDKVVKEVNLPRKLVKIYGIEMMEKYEKNLNQIEGLEEVLSQMPDDSIQSKYKILKINISCSKGTYIRQLAVDIGEKLDMPTMLISLKRTRIGDYILPYTTDF